MTWTILHWFVTGGVVVCAGWLVVGRLVPKPAARPQSHERVTIDEDGITREVGGKHERTRWSDLVEVAILTTSGGPYVEDLFFVLKTADGRECVIPSDVATEIELLAPVQKLPGFDNQKVVEAMGSCDDAVFVCWRAGGEKGV